MTNSEVDEFLYHLDDSWNHDAGKIEYTKSLGNHYIDFITGNNESNKAIIEQLISGSKFITITGWDDKGNFSGRINR